MYVGITKSAKSPSPAASQEEFERLQMQLNGKSQKFRDFFEDMIVELVSGKSLKTYPVFEDLLSKLHACTRNFAIEMPSEPTPSLRILRECSRDKM